MQEFKKGSLLFSQASGLEVNLVWSKNPNFFSKSKIFLVQIPNFSWYQNPNFWFKFQIFLGTKFQIFGPNSRFFLVPKSKFLVQILEFYSQEFSIVKYFDSQDFWIWQVGGLLKGCFINRRNRGLVISEKRFVECEKSHKVKKTEICDRGEKIRRSRKEDSSIADGEIFVDHENK